VHDSDSLDAFGDLDQLGKGGGIVPGKMGKGLAVDIDVGFVQAVDEPAIAHVVDPAGCIDADDPEPAELSLFLLPVSEGKGKATLNCLAGNSVCFAAGAKIAPGGKHIFLSSAMGGNVICDSWHGFLLNPQHPLDLLFIGLANDGALAKITFQFRAFLGFDVS